MNWILPDREAAQRKGWTHQVQWMDDGKPCFVRLKSGVVADEWATKLRSEGKSPTVIDLNDALQVH